MATERKASADVDFLDMQACSAIPIQNLGSVKAGARCRCALKRGRDLESWSNGICLLDEWFPFSSSQPRLGRAHWVHHIPLLARTVGVLHYRFGGTAR